MGAESASISDHRRRSYGIARIDFAVTLMLCYSQRTQHHNERGGPGKLDRVLRYSRPGTVGPMHGDFRADRNIHWLSATNAGESDMDGETWRILRLYDSAGFRNIDRSSGRTFRAALAVACIT